VRYAQYSTFVGLALVIILVLVTKENWRATVVSLLISIS
jgi:hypothetical protein